MVKDENIIKINAHSKTKPVNDDGTKSATMDYYDTRIGGILEDATSPSGLQFAAALLRKLYILLTMNKGGGRMCHFLKPTQELSKKKESYSTDIWHGNCFYDFIMETTIRH